MAAGGYHRVPDLVRYRKEAIMSIYVPLILECDGCGATTEVRGTLRRPAQENASDSYSPFTHYHSYYVIDWIDTRYEGWDVMGDAARCPKYPRCKETRHVC